jgi:hypothetical protein
MKVIELATLLLEKIEKCELSEDSVVYFRDDREFVHDISYDIETDEEGDACLTDGLPG